jgi:hypothetical protein
MILGGDEKPPRAMERAAFVPKIHARDNEPVGKPALLRSQAPWCEDDDQVRFSTGFPKMENFSMFIPRI